MKLKQLLKKTEFKYFILLILLIILALPFIFQEEEPKKIFSKGFFLLPQEDAALPVYPKGNAPIKPAKKLKDGFVVEEEPATAPQNVIQKIKENIKTNNSKPAISRDFLFMDEEEETAPSLDNSAYYQNEGNYNYDSDTMLTKNSANIIPAKDGYYHDGKFYKEGTYPPNADKKAIDRAINHYHNTGGQAKGHIPNTKGARLTPFGNNYPTARGLEKDSAYKPFPSNWDTLPTIVKAENFKDAKAHEGGSISSFNNRDNWPNGYYDNYNPYSFNMHAMYDAVSNGIKDMIANNFYNIERPDGAYGSGNSAASSSGSSSLRTTNSGSRTSRNSNDGDKTTATKSNKNRRIGANDTPMLAIGIDPNNYGDGEIDNEYNSFAANYANYGLQHYIGCNTDAFFSGTEKNDLGITNINEDGAFYLRPGSCPTPFEAHVAEVSNFISKKKNFYDLRSEVAEIASNIETNSLNIVSTDRTVYPLVQTLNDIGITNSKGETITINAIGPNQEKTNLADALNNITNALVTDDQQAKKLNAYLMEFYYISQLKTINTMLAFQDTKNADHVIVLNDPNNSYWLKNSPKIAQYKRTTISQNGVTYNGVSVSKKDIGNIINEERTNLLYISGNDNDKMVLNNETVNKNKILKNGSAIVVDLKDEEYSISSLDPKDIYNNANLVGYITASADNELSIMKSKK